MSNQLIPPLAPLNSCDTVSLLDVLDICIGAGVDDVYVRRDLYLGKYRPDMTAYNRYIFCTTLFYIKLN